MPWLVAGDRVLASVEVASDRQQRRRGLLGRDGVDGVLLIERARSVHSIGMRFAIDVAFCDDEMKVLRVVTMRPHRVGAPVFRAKHVLEAEAGAFARWGIERGVELEIRR